MVGKRTDFRLIVTSATLDSAKFSTFFGAAPVFVIPGRQVGWEGHHRCGGWVPYITSLLLKHPYLHSHSLLVRPAHPAPPLTRTPAVRCPCPRPHPSPYPLRSLL